MSVLSEVHLIGKALQEAGKIDLYQKLLAILKRDLELQEENQKLKETIKHLSEELQTKGALRFDNNAYFLMLKSGQKEGPFCSACWDSKKTLVRLHDLGDCECCPSCRYYGATSKRGPR